MKNINYFDHAVGWYKRGGDFRVAALELFSKAQLEGELARYEHEKRLERNERREKDLKEALEKCKKMYPIGTLIWSDEGSDHLPNLIVGEPYIGATKYKAPYGVYEFDEDNRKTVLAKTLRLRGTQIVDEDIVELEKCLADKTPYYHSNHEYHVIDLEKFHEEEEEARRRTIADLKESIERLQRQLEEEKKRLANAEEYNPLALTKESTKQIIKEYDTR